MNHGLSAGNMRNDDQTRSMISREAAEWCITMGSGEASSDEKIRFAEWIKRSPHHLSEYAAIEALWEEAAAYGPELRRNGRVVNLFPGKTDTPAGRGVDGLVRRLGVAAATVAALLVGGLVWIGSNGALFTDAETSRIYETIKGETRAVSLADGSVVHLNTSSAVSVAYTAERRLIRLERGQAYFDVHKAPSRPFVVAVSGAEVEAVGTAFDVEAFGPELAVTVVEGEVLVRSTARGTDVSDVGADAASDAADGDENAQVEAGWSTRLKANQQIMLTTAVKPIMTPPKPVSVTARAATAWRENKLVFDGEPLKGVAEKFNRYNSRRIVVLDEELQALKISGSFDPRDPEAFAETLAAAAGLTVDKRLENNILLRD